MESGRDALVLEPITTFVEIDVLKSFPALQLLLRCLSQRRDVSWLAVWGHIWCLTHEKRIFF